ncbi:MAG: acetylxylan esterase, partial [Pirellulales bacterium]|nr:acetylxylan esterase [Pirellulales bacterium]
FAVPATPDAWSKRAAELRRQLQVAEGLWPMPTKTPSNAVVHGPVDRKEYTVEKVFFESFPGHFVTGNLYRPKGREGKLPAVLCPHGHWADGRFYDRGAKEVRWDLFNGAERFEMAGRFPLQSRCVQLARMGCVVFHYDMIGYADSIQLAHRAGVRDKMNKLKNWGYFSPQAEARLQHQMGLQTYNSVRALDWISTLPYVDGKRIAVTGASGGGTQTFILCALDPRPAVAFPAVMVSTAMQGGCPCENASFLRVGTGNIELAALIAPRPLGMTAADDWTKEIATKGLPELKQLYKMLGVEDLVMAKPLVQFPHNYNYVSRGAMYHWLNKHLKLGFEEPVVAEDFQPLSVAEMTVWDKDHPKPPSGDDYERSLLAWITADSYKQMAELVPRDAKSLEKFREVVGGAIDTIIGRRLPEKVTMQIVGGKEEELGNYRLSRLLIQNKVEKEELPAVMLKGKKTSDDPKKFVIWIDPQGKAALFDEAGQPIAPVRKLLDAGRTVLGVDLYGQGEFTKDGKPIAKARLNKYPSDDPWIKYAGFTFGYNHSVFVKRVHDIMSAVALLRDMKPAQIDLVGLAGAGHWVAAARAQAGPIVNRTVIDTSGFRFAKIDSFDHPDFLPGGAKYLDLPGMLALCAPAKIWLAGEGAYPEVVKATYKAAGEAEAMTVADGEKATVDHVVKWLLAE